MENEKTIAKTQEEMFEVFFGNLMQSYGEWNDRILPVQNIQGVKEEGEDITDEILCLLLAIFSVYKIRTGNEGCDLLDFTHVLQKMVFNDMAKKVVTEITDALGGITELENETV